MIMFRYDEDSPVCGAILCAQPGRKSPSVLFELLKILMNKCRVGRMAHQLSYERFEQSIHRCMAIWLCHCLHEQVNNGKQL